MKKNNSIFFKVTLIAGIMFMLTLGILISCEKKTVEPLSIPDYGSRQRDLINTTNYFPVAKLCGGVDCKKLLTNEKEEVGQLFIFSDQKWMFLRAIAHADFKLSNAYLFAGVKDRLPFTSGGDPNVIAFNYRIENKGYATVRDFKIPLSQLGRVFAMSLMVEFNEVTDHGKSILRAWGQGLTIGSHSLRKGMVFLYDKGNCP